MIGGEDDQRIIDTPIGFEAIQQATDLLIHQADHAVVNGAQLGDVAGGKFGPDLGIAPDLFL